MTRTQIYLTDHQKAAVSKEASREGIPMAEVIRRAIDRFVVGDGHKSDPKKVLDDAFGAVPGLEAPSRREWDRDFG